MAASRKYTVRSLANEAGMDYDLAVVTLWDAGFDEVVDIDDEVPLRSIQDFQAALGVTSAKKMQCVSFWEKKWGLNSFEARLKLGSYGIDVTSNARNLPKGALRKLRSAGVATPIISPPKLTPLALNNEPSFSWNQIGRQSVPELLSVEEIKEIHQALMVDFANTADPIEPPGVKDENLLESAAFRPATELSGCRKYSSAELGASAILHSLIHNHPFYNGNKRTALVAAMAMLDRNDVLLTCNESDLFKLVLRVAQHRIVPRDWSSLADRETQEMATWIYRNSRAIEHGDRLIKWRELRKILSRYDCTISNPMPGNRIKVERRIQQKGFFGIGKARTISSTVGYRSEGHEVDQTLLKRLRKDLWLDEEHGVDSAYFYGTDKRQPDEFINQYRSLLKRLAKL